MALRRAVKHTAGTGVKPWHTDSNRLMFFVWQRAFRCHVVARSQTSVLPLNGQALNVCIDSGVFQQKTLWIPISCNYIVAFLFK